MQARVCVPVASGTWFSSQEFWIIWTLMFYKTPLAVAVPSSTCLVSPTKTGQQSHNAQHQHTWVWLGITKCAWYLAPIKLRVVAAWPGCVKSNGCKVGTPQPSLCCKPHPKLLPIPQYVQCLQAWACCSAFDLARLGGWGSGVCVLVGGASQPQHLVHFPKPQTLQLTYCTTAYSTPSHSSQDFNTKKGTSQET